MITNPTEVLKPFLSYHFYQKQTNGRSTYSPFNHVQIIKYIGLDDRKKSTKGNHIVQGNTVYSRIIFSNK